MRRYLAAGIDFIINYVIGIIVYYMIISVWKWIRILNGPEIRSYPRIIVMVLFPLIFILINMIYTVIFDSVFCGLTPGKRVLGCKVYEGHGSQMADWKWIQKHALLRSLAALFYVITALYYLKHLRMPYDTILENLKS